MKYGFYKAVLCFAVLILAGCTERSDLAPVSELSVWTFSTFQKTHTVRQGDTLYSIAFHYDSDYRQLAQLNHLRPPYILKIGQVLSVNGQASVKRPVHTLQYSQPQRPYVKPRVVYSAPLQRRSFTGWYWPVKGRVVAFYLPNQGKKGIDIASKRGEKVYASAAGVVAYSGSGLSGYGNLIIIKHNHEFLTAYGNNSKNLVKEGQPVKAGQTIAEIGVVDHKYWGLHFEIRRAGKPVNPLIYLQKA